MCERLCMVCEGCCCCGEWWLWSWFCCLLMWPFSPSELLLWLGLCLVGERVHCPPILSIMRVWMSQKLCLGCVGSYIVLGSLGMKGVRSSHGEVTPLSSWEPRANKKKSIFSKLHHQNGSKFYQLFFMSRYTWYLLHGKKLITKSDDLLFLENIPFLTRMM